MIIVTLIGVKTKNKLPVEPHKGILWWSKVVTIRHSHGGAFHALLTWGSWWVASFHVMRKHRGNTTNECHQHETQERENNPPSWSDCWSNPCISFRYQHHCLVKSPHVKVKSTTLTLWWPDTSAKSIYLMVQSHFWCWHEYGLMGM